MEAWQRPPDYEEDLAKVRIFEPEREEKKAKKRRKTSSPREEEPRGTEWWNQVESSEAGYSDRKTSSPTRRAVEPTEVDTEPLEKPRKKKKGDGGWVAPGAAIDDEAEFLGRK